MLITVPELQPYLKEFHITGVLHIGAHDCEELPLYESIGVSSKDVIWVDAEACKVLENVSKGVPNVFHACVSDSDDSEVIFNISNNSESSSILKLGTHAHHYPGIVFINSLPMKTTKIDTFLTRNGFDSGKYNFWNLDIQGAELLALKGSSNSLKHVDVLYLEVNTEAVYCDGALINELDEYLIAYDLHRVVTKMTGAGWGDALYVKNRSIPLEVLSTSESFLGEHAVIQRFIGPDSVVFDVGGNIGEWADLALLQNASRIHIFEPLPWLAASLTTKFTPSDRITVNCCALSDKSGEAEFNYYEYCDKMSGFHVRKVVPQIPVKIVVPLIPLSKYCTNNGITHINFLKIDTEGHELAVLKGATHVLPCTDYIQFEYGGTYPDAGIKLRQVFELLFAFGFKLFKIMDSSLKYCPVWMDALEDYSYCNYLAVSSAIVAKIDIFKYINK